jgi:hypothetical protein
MAHQRGAANAAATTSEGVETLAAAMDQFAESQIAIGEGAVELSGQSEVANQALRDALTLAMKFSQSMAAPEASEQAMSGDVDRTMPEKREPMAQTEIPKAPAHQRESAGTPPVHDPLGDAEDIVLPVNMKADLGTGFVPKSPDVTANMMIGSEMRAAMEAADLALGRDKSRGKQKNKTLAKRKSKNHSEEAAAEPDDTPQQDEVAGGVAQMSPNQGKTSTVDNAPVRPGALQRQKEGTKVSGNSSGPRGSETDVTGSRQSQELPWLVKLPSELRRSIRAGAQQRAPKAYETRLREYFESVE